MPGGVTYRDLVVGVEFPLAEGFVPDSIDFKACAALLANSLTVAYGVSPVMSPEEVAKYLVSMLAKLSTFTGTPVTPSINQRGNSLVADISTPFGPAKLRVWRSQGLTRYTITSGGSEEWLFRVIERARIFRKPSGDSRIIVDPQRGVPALSLEIPAGCSLAYRYAPSGVKVRVSCGKAEVIVETWNGLHGAPIVAQVAAARGLYYGSPPGTVELAPEDNWEFKMATGAPPIASIYKTEMFAYRMYGMPGREEGLLLVGDNIAAWTWRVVTVMRMPAMAQLVSWTAGRAYAHGKMAGSMLLTVLSHLQVREELMRALSRESQAEYRRGMRIIREMRMMTRSIARSFRSSRSPSPETPYYGSASRDTSVWRDEAYTPGDEWMGDDVEERWGDTWSGQADYYLDEDGMLRNYSSGEEIVGELGDEGVIYDSEGREIGYIQDGYVYDYETGEQVGVFHPEASDKYQMERAEQMASDPSSTYGYEDNVFAPERRRISPYHSSSRQEDENA